MSTPYLGQIQTFGFSYPPKGWALCNGQLLSISQNTALFSLLGTYYGGDGRVNFGLPNLQGRFAVSQGNDFFGNGYVMGQAAGEASHTLILSEIPVHTHNLVASSAPGSVGTPVNNFPAPAANGASLFGSTANTTLGASSVLTGGSQAHANMPPFLVINYCIALVGIFPSRN